MLDPGAQSPVRVVNRRDTVGRGAGGQVVSAQAHRLPVRLGDIPTDTAYRRPDFEVAAYFLLTHPSSPFSGNLVVQRSTGATRYALTGLTLTVDHPDGGRSTDQVAPDHLADTLRDVFGLVLDDAGTKAILAFIDDRR